MKITQKYLKYLYLFIIMGIVIGSLCWEILERLIAMSGINLNLSVGPVGFDISVLSLYLKINPGSFIGAAGIWFLIKKI
jgi:hypothetical protein